MKATCTALLRERARPPLGGPKVKGVSEPRPLGDEMISRLTSCYSFLILYIASGLCFTLLIQVGSSDQPIPCTSLDGTTEAKYFLQFKGVWSDKVISPVLELFTTPLLHIHQTKHL